MPSLNKEVINNNAMFYPASIYWGFGVLGKMSIKTIKKGRSEESGQFWESSGPVLNVFESVINLRKFGEIS